LVAGSRGGQIGDGGRQRLALLRGEIGEGGIKADRQYRLAASGGHGGAYPGRRGDNRPGQLGEDADGCSAQRRQPTVSGLVMVGAS